jgi:hypothetical protein
MQRVALVGIVLSAATCATACGSASGSSTSQSSRITAPKSSQAVPAYQTAPDGKLWSAELSHMIPTYNEQDDLVSPEYFQPKQDIDANINKGQVIATVDNLLHNRWYAIFTGKKDDLLATFGKSRYDTATGEWGSVHSQVEEIATEHGQDAAARAVDPNFPLGSTVVTKVNDIKPIVSPEVVEVTAEIKTTEYSLNSDNQARQSAIYQRLTMDLEYQKITNWSDGGERTMWVVTGWQINRLLGCANVSGCPSPTS